jgi:hypothetical protein
MVAKSPVRAGQIWRRAAELRRTTGTWRKDFAEVLQAGRRRSIKGMAKGGKGSILMRDRALRMTARERFIVITIEAIKALS